MSGIDQEKFIQDCLDGKLDETEKKELFALLKGDAEMMRLYCLSAALDTSLTRFSNGQLSLKDAPQSIAEIANESRKSRSSKTSLIAAAAALILGAIILRLILIPDQVIPLTFQVAPGTMMDLTHSGDVSEHPTGNELAVGSQMTLTQGAVELKLKNGVRAIVQAPADFILKSPDQLYLDHGTAWFHVPIEGKGFQAITPYTKIVDYGTEFGILTHRNTFDEIHLMKGEIEVTSRRALKKQETLTGKSARLIDSAGRLKTIPLNEELFRKQLPVIHRLPVKWRTIGDSNLLSPGSPPSSDLKVINPTWPEGEPGINGSFSQILLRADGDRISMTGEVTFSDIANYKVGASLNFGLFQNEGTIFAPIWSGYRITCAGPNHASHLRWKNKSEVPNPADSNGVLLWKSSLVESSLQSDTVYHFYFSLTRIAEGILIESAFNDGLHEFAKSSQLHRADKTTLVFNSVAFQATQALSPREISIQNVEILFAPSNGPKTKNSK